MIPTETRQYITHQDGLDALTQVTTPLRQLKDNEVLVKINTVSLNYRDTEVVMGLYNHHASHAGSQRQAFVPGADMAGEIVAVGSQVTEWKTGDRCLSIFHQAHLTGQIKESDMLSGLGMPLEGILQTYRIFPAQTLVRTPADLPDEQACILPIAFVTAWMSLNWMQPIGQPISGKDVVVLLQGTGGVSIAGLQLAHALGLTTIITSSSDQKLQRAKALGATHTINYRTTPAWDKEVMKVTNGQGADVIFEMGGALTLDQSYECVKFGGSIACIGYLSGKVDKKGDQLNTNVLALKRNVTLKGIINGPKDRLDEVNEFVHRHQIKPVVDKVFPFDQAAAAFKYVYSGSHFGKAVIKVQ